MKRDAGLPPRRDGRKGRWSDGEILQALRVLAERHGEQLTLNLFRRETGISPSTLMNRFGGWLALREMAGLGRLKGGRQNARVFSKERLVEQLRTVVKTTGPHLSEMEFCERVRVSTTTIHRYWGSWVKLRLAAGLAARPRRKRLYTQVDLLLELHRVVRELGTFPTKDQLDRLSRIGPETFVKRFGSMEFLRQRYSAFAVRLMRVLAEAARKG